jgi:hypothetical protein
MNKWGTEKSNILIQQVQAPPGPGIDANGESGIKVTIRYGSMFALSQGFIKFLFILTKV